MLKVQGTPVNGELKRKTICKNSHLHQLNNITWLVAYINGRNEHCKNTMHA